MNPFPFGVARYHTIEHTHSIAPTSSHRFELDLKPGDSIVSVVALAPEGRSFVVSAVGASFVEVWNPHPVETVECRLAVVFLRPSIE